jgi:hypothetical protein
MEDIIQSIVIRDAYHFMTIIRCGLFLRDDNQANRSRVFLFLDSDQLFSLLLAILRVNCAARSLEAGGRRNAKNGEKVSGRAERRLEKNSVGFRSYIIW